MDVLAGVNEYVRAHYDQDEYNWLHNEYMTRTSLRLGRLLGADLEILEIAAWLHDIDYSRGKEFHVVDSSKNDGY